MGYRNYLGSLPKKEYNKIKRMTIQELYVFKNEVWVEDYSEGYVGVYDVAYNTHYELGKYVDQFDKKFFNYVHKDNSGFFTYRINLRAAYEQAYDVIVPILEREAENTKDMAYSLNGTPAEKATILNQLQEKLNHHPLIIL